MEFSVKIQRIDASVIPGWGRMRRSLAQYDNTLRQVLSEIHGYSYGSVHRAIARAIDRNAENIQSIHNLESGLQEILKLYTDVENQLSEQGERWDGIQESSGAEAEASGGISEGSEEGDNGDGIWDYLTDALEQIILGDFTDESNALGITVSVILGFVPILGTVLDVRDLVADIYNLIDDGPETSEWVDLGFTLVAFIPGIGDFCKNADNYGDILKHFDDIADGLGDVVKGTMKKAGDIYSAAEDCIQGFNRMMDGKVYSRLADKLDDIVRKFPNGTAIKDAITDFLDKPFFGDTMGDACKEWIKEMTGVEDMVKDFISDGLDKAGEWVSDGVHQVGEWLNEGYERITDGIRDVIGNGSILHGFSSAVKAW